MKLFVGFSILTALTISAADAATLSVYGSVGLSGIDTQTGDPAGGNDYQDIVTNSAGGSDAGAVIASVSGITGNGTAYSSANIATGELKLSVGGNSGTYYANVPARVIGQELSVSGGSLFSEYFTASGSGTVQFDLEYDGFWDLTPQRRVACCDSNGNVVEDTVAPFWFVSGALSLGGNGGLLAGDGFSFSNTNDANSGVAGGILSIISPVVEGWTYGISAHMDMLMNYSSGSIDFANTATLSYSVSPGVVLNFEDSRFLTKVPDTPSPVPLPAGFLLLGSALFGLAALGRRSVYS